MALNAEQLERVREEHAFWVEKYIANCVLEKEGEPEDREFIARWRTGDATSADIARHMTKRDPGIYAPGNGFRGLYPSGQEWMRDLYAKQRNDALQRFHAHLSGGALAVYVACQLAKCAVDGAEQVYLASCDENAECDVQRRFISLATTIEKGLGILDDCEKAIPRRSRDVVTFCGRSDSTAIRRALRWADDYVGMVYLCIVGYGGGDAAEVYYGNSSSVGPLTPISRYWANEHDAQALIRSLARAQKTALREIQRLPFPEEEGPQGREWLMARMDSELAAAEQWDLREKGGSEDRREGSTSAAIPSKDQQPEIKPQESADAAPSSDGREQTESSPAPAAGAREHEGPKWRLRHCAEFFVAGNASLLLEKWQNRRDGGRFVAPCSKGGQGRADRFYAIQVLHHAIANNDLEPGVDTDAIRQRMNGLPDDPE